MAVFCGTGDWDLEKKKSLSLYGTTEYIIGCLFERIITLKPAHPPHKGHAVLKKEKKNQKRNSVFGLAQAEMGLNSILW